MAKKRGLGRGIGALIPSSEPASSENSEEPEAKSPEPSATGTEPPSPSKKDSDASPAPTEAEVAQSTSAGTRGVDMFFSSDDSSTAEAREHRKAADLELADSWARDARSKRRGGKKPAAKHDFVLSSGGGMGHHAAAH